MKLLFFSLLVLIRLSTNGQILQKFKLKPHQKQWDNGSLTWEDFQGTPPAKAGQSSELQYQLIYEPAKLKSADSTFYYNQVYGFIDQKLSWAREKTPEHLQYNQAKFNLLEIYRRQLQRELSSPLSGRDAHLLAGKAIYNLKNSIGSLQQNSADGRDAGIVAAFLDSTNQVLTTQNKPKNITFALGNLGLGTHLGFGYRNFTRSLGDHFSNTAGWEYNLAVSFKKSFLNLDLAIGFSEISKVFPERAEWETGKEMSMVQAGVSYGYAVIDKAKFRITPFAGIAALGIQPRDHYFHGINNTSAFYGGFQIDYKLKKRIWLIPSFISPKEMTDFGLRAQVMVMPVQYNNSLKGTTIGLTLAPYLVTRRIKNKKLY